MYNYTKGAMSHLGRKYIRMGKMIHFYKLLMKSIYIEIITYCIVTLRIL